MGSPARGLAEAVNPTVEGRVLAGQLQDSALHLRARPTTSTSRPIGMAGNHASATREGLRRGRGPTSGAIGKDPHAEESHMGSQGQATRDAWHRIERALPGDADGDGI